MITKEQIEEMSEELNRLKDKNFDVGIHDISDNMKNVVNTLCGDQEWSCCGYWMNAQKIVQEYTKVKLGVFFDTHSGKGIFR